MITNYTNITIIDDSDAIAPRKGMHIGMSILSILFDIGASLVQYKINLGVVVITKHDNSKYV